MRFISIITTSYRNALASVTQPTWTLMVHGSVPSDQRRFLREEAFKLKWVLKFFKRWTLFVLLGQRRVTLLELPPRAMRILWINLTAPSLGDALMDLSSRRLLADRELHLLTHPKNAPLFGGDEYFSKVMSRAADARYEHASHPYDLIIVDSFSLRSLLPKVWVSRSCPLVAMYGFVNGFEVHRTLYSFGRLSYLMSYDELDVVPRIPSISLGHVPMCLSLKSRQGATLIAIGVGGEWAFRTYSHWIRVLEGLLLVGPSFNFVLLGSLNGVLDATHIERSLPANRVDNLVGVTSLLDSCSVLRQCDAYVGADGGLWHLATACGLPSVALFADCQLYDDEGRQVSRASPDQVCVSLLAESNVNQIDPRDVTKATLSILKLNGKA